MEIAVLVLIVAVVTVLGVAAFVLVRHRGRTAAPRIVVADRAERAERAAADAPVEVEAPAPAVAADVGVLPEAEPAVEPAVEPPPVRPSFGNRLGRAREAIAGPFRSVLGRSSIEAATWDDLEDALIGADVGVELTGELLEELRDVARTQRITDPAALLVALKELVVRRLEGADRTLRHESGPMNVWLFVGVNGVGKTTTIGKVGRAETLAGRSVVMAAGDTFRAAAAEQLGTWAERAGCDFVRGAEGGDPSSVVFDAVQRAAARNADLVLADTAGRLHTKSNLMDELAKVRRVADREPGRVTECLLVLDAVTGQNGLVQAEQFTAATALTGVVLTKLDGSAKGGIVLAIEHRLGIPVKLVGLGEGVDDLVAFDPVAFADALFG